jgi:hypothetical protein
MIELKHQNTFAQPQRGGGFGRPRRKSLIWINQLRLGRRTRAAQTATFGTVLTHNLERLRNPPRLRSRLADCSNAAPKAGPLLWAH